VEDVACIDLEFTDEPAKQERMEGKYGVGANEHDINQDVFFPFLAGISPGCPEKRDVRIGGHRAKLG
jgi:hypothetical protein